jgi:hypothetical protein
VAVGVAARGFAAKQEKIWLGQENSVRRGLRGRGYFCLYGTRSFRAIQGSLRYYSRLLEAFSFFWTFQEGDIMLGCSRREIRFRF